MELINEFSNKSWTKSSINRLLTKFRFKSAVNRLRVSDRPRITRIEESVDLVNDLWF